jgi:hypothetical protein
VRVPTVVGCVWFEKSQRGHCYTQQGTTVAAPVSFIKQFIEKGMFEDFERGPAVGGNSGGFNEAKPLTTSPPPPASPSPSAGLTALDIRPVMASVPAVSVLTGDAPAKGASNAR